MKSRPTSNYSSTYSSAKKDSLITGLGASHKQTTTLLRPQSSEIAKKLETTKKLLKGPDVSVSSKLVSNISQDIQSKLGLNKFTKEPSRTIGGTVLSTSIKSVGQYRHSSTLDTNNSSKAAGRLTDLAGQQAQANKSDRCVRQDQASTKTLLEGWGSAPTPQDPADHDYVFEPKVLGSQEFKFVQYLQQP